MALARSATSRPTASSHRRLGIRLGGRPALRLRPGQPGGFFYNILPYMEQQALHDLSLAATNDSDRNSLGLLMIQSPLSVWNCPTRRTAAAFPVRTNRRWLVNTSIPSDVAVGWYRTDYKCNGGFYGRDGVRPR